LSLGLGVRLALIEPRIVEKPVFVHDASPELDPYVPTASVGGAESSRYVDVMKRTSFDGGLPPVEPLAGKADGAGPIPLRPTLERDLDFPPGSLRNLVPQP
jgi:hypothetical protein